MPEVKIKTAKRILPITFDQYLVVRLRIMKQLKLLKSQFQKKRNQK